MGKHDEYEDAKQTYKELKHEAYENAEKDDDDPTKQTKEEEIRHTQNMLAYSEE